MLRFLPVVALAAKLVAGIAFTDPVANATVTKGSYYDLTWSTVDTDPDTFSIYLVNFVSWPPSYQALSLDVETASGETSVYVPCDVDDSYGYQFNAINGTNVYVIYAQTPKFIIGGSDCTDPTTSASTCAAAATVTVTVSTTLSASATSGAFGNSSSIVGANTTITTTSTARVTVGGECPDIIGWGPSGYSYPVTLTQVPTAPGSSATTTVGPVEVTASASPSYATTVYSTTFIDMAEATACNC